MNKFDELNYYEVLEIPEDASPFEITRAYKNALENYSEKSLLTYSLFTNAERVRIITKVNDAYNTLIDRAKRITYDASLSNQTTAVDRQQEHSCCLDFPNRPHREDYIDAKNEGRPASAKESVTCLTSQDISVETRAGKSSINTARLFNRDLDNKSVENKDLGARRSFWGQPVYRVFVVLALVALILIALSLL